MNSSCSEEDTSLFSPLLLLQFVALYDYDPQKSSPSPNPEFELQLREGNLVKVFGREMSDGFLMGEVRSMHTTTVAVVCLG